MPTYLKTWFFIATLLALATAASAEGIAQAPVRAAAVSDESWTGVGVGLRAGVAQGAVDFGGGGMNVTGQDAGALVFLRQQFGPLVLGLDAGYDRLWGDLKTFGVDYTLTVGASAGVLPSKASLLYVRGEWLRAAGSGNHIDGWGLGVGAEQKIAGTPISLGIEYMHDWMDNAAFGGLTTTADRVMLVGRWQFSAPRGLIP